MTEIRLMRAYDPPTDADGYRVLVDRLWPRGVAKAKLKLDDWAKDVAPSTELRQWFGHQVPKWPEFERRYRAELADNPVFDDLVAEGIVDAAKMISEDGKSLPVPVVVRLEGTNVERGREILQDTPIANVIMAPTMEGGAETIVRLVKEADGRA